MKAEHDKDGNRPLERVVSLRPCPFCGGKVKWGRADDERVKMLIEAARDLLGAVDADSRVKRGDYYHARKSVRVALASFEQANT